GYADVASRVHPRFFRRQKRSFQVNAKHTRFTVDGLLNGNKRRFGFLRCVADESRQQRGSAEATMCRRDRANAVGTCDIIEENVAAAVHLQVDKAWCEPALFWKSQNRRRRGELTARFQANNLLLSHTDSS